MADATPPCFFFHAPLVLSQMRTTTVDRAALHRQAGPATASFPRSALTARARAGVRRRAALVAVAPRASAVSSDASLTRPPADGRDLYAPPSFTALVADATASLAAALEDGRKLVEVEFPALPGDKDGAREGEKEGEREKEGGGGARPTSPPLCGHSRLESTSGMQGVAVGETSPYQRTQGVFLPRERERACELEGAPFSTRPLSSLSPPPGKRAPLSPPPQATSAPPTSTSTATSSLPWRRLAPCWRPGAWRRRGCLSPTRLN